MTITVSGLRVVDFGRPDRLDRDRLAWAHEVRHLTQPVVRGLAYLRIEPFADRGKIFRSQQGDSRFRQRDVIGKPGIWCFGCRRRNGLAKRYRYY